MTEPFDPNGRLIVVPVVLTSPRGTHDFRFAVDCAATRTSISGLLLQRLGYTEPLERDRQTVRTGSGMTSAGFARIGGLLALGQLKTDYQVFWMPHPPGSMIDGLLGLDFFRGLVLTLDFARGQIALRQRSLWWQFWR